MFVHDIAADSALVTLLAGVLGPRTLVASIHCVGIVESWAFLLVNKKVMNWHWLAALTPQRPVPCTGSPYFRGDACESNSTHKLLVYRWALSIHVRHAIILRTGRRCYKTRESIESVVVVVLACVQR